MLIKVCREDVTLHSDNNHCVLFFDDFDGFDVEVIHTSFDIEEDN